MNAMKKISLLIISLAAIYPSSVFGGKTPSEKEGNSEENKAAHVTHHTANPAVAISGEQISQLTAELQQLRRELSLHRAAPAVTNTDNSGALRVGVPRADRSDLGDRRDK